MEGAGACQPPVLGIADVAALFHAADRAAGGPGSHGQSVEGTVRAAGCEVDGIRGQAAGGHGDGAPQRRGARKWGPDRRRYTPPLRPAATILISRSRGYGSAT